MVTASCRRPWLDMHWGLLSAQEPVLFTFAALHQCQAVLQPMLECESHQLTQFRSTSLPAAGQHTAAHARNLVQYKQQTAMHVRSLDML